VHKVLERERRAVIEYALRHPSLRHRELAWRMVDEDVAYLSPSTVYRILRDRGLLRGWDRRKEQRERRQAERAGRPDERWQTDICYIAGKDRKYYLVIFVDEYSRYLVHAEVLLSMAGDTVSLSAQGAIEKLDKETHPEIQSDNGSAYVSRDFKVVLSQNGIGHHRIHPHCPEENGIVERVHRTVKERLSETEQESLAQIQDEVENIRQWYNERRLHSALHFLRPVDYYRGDPEKLLQERQRKLAAARHVRKETNLGRKQRTFDLKGTGQEGTTIYQEPDLSTFV
jgi:transposase InsO family protein